MRAPSVTTARRAGAVLALGGLALTASASAVAAAVGGGAAVVTAPVVSKQPDTNGCNGVKATPGSENTSKTLTGGSMQPGGVASFAIEYPIEADSVGSTFTITDCVFVDDVAVEKYEISFVPNHVAYTLAYAIEIPETTPIGAEYCNYAKTTGGPSSPQASNRKANPACFTVGGALRVEKRDGAGALLPGATFSVACTPAAAVPPVVVAGLSETGVAATGVIGIDGPEGTPCVVTEVAAPAGYALGASPARTLTIPRGTAATTEVWVNEAIVEPTVDPTIDPTVDPTVDPTEDPTEEPTEDPTEEPTEEPMEEDPTEEPTYDGPTVEPDDPAPTISPTVLGVKVTRAPAPPASLPTTGGPVAALLAAGLSLTALGGGIVAGAGRYRHRH